MRSTVALCVEAFIDDFNNRWGSGKNVLTYREGKRRQPPGFRSKHLMATVLDPRTKVLYEIEDYEHEGLLTILPRRAAEIAVTKQAGGCPTCSSCCILGLQRIQDRL